MLPSGIGKRTDDHKIAVVDYGQATELTVVWPELMINPEALHTIWKKSSKPELQAEGILRANDFRPTLRSLRSNTGQKIISKCQIALQPNVKPDQKIEPNVNLEYVQSKSGGETVSYITLDTPHAGYQVDAVQEIKPKEV